MPKALFGVQPELDNRLSINDVCSQRWKAFVHYGRFAKNGVLQNGTSELFIASNSKLF